MIGAFLFLLAGLGMVFCNGPLARGIAAVNRALADRLPQWIRRWFFWPAYQPWFGPYARVGLIAMGLLWTFAALVLLGLIALGVRVTD
jgi:hypothetical protein